MTQPSTQHSTIVTGRIYEAPVRVVYAAFCDPASRRSQSPASDGSVIFLDEADLRIGGRDIFRFGQRHNPRLHGHSLYHDIVPECRIVCTDIVYEREQRLSVALSTFEFKPLMERTQLKVTAQLVFLHHAVTLDASNARYQTLIGNLTRALERPGRAPPRRPGPN